MENVKFIVKKENREVEKFISHEETKKILFKIGLPEAEEYTDFKFDDKIKIILNNIVIGSFFAYDIIIDLNNKEAIYASKVNSIFFLNSSLGQFSKYILLFVDFINKKIKDPAGRSKYLREWETKMIEIDKESYYHPDYYWGSLFEQYEQGALM